MMNNDAATPVSVGLLTGKVIFITGASRGIGAAAAHLFADEGASVVLAARGTEALHRIVADIRRAGGIADAVTVDLADRASIRAAMTRVRDLHGRLDGAFNNGGPPGRTPRGRRGRRLAALRPRLHGHRRDHSRRRRSRSMTDVSGKTGRGPPGRGATSQERRPLCRAFSWGSTRRR
jgi:NAD(P)-dependent dehydrogenase (short-subunit alcohol dehydrogenase family)